MATAIPVLVAFAFIETAKTLTTTLLAPSLPEVPEIGDLPDTGLRREISNDQAGRGTSRLGSVANTSGVPGGDVRVGQPSVLLGPSPASSGPGGVSNA